MYRKEDMLFKVGKIFSKCQADSGKPGIPTEKFLCQRASYFWLACTPIPTLSVLHPLLPVLTPSYPILLHLCTGSYLAFSIMYRMRNEFLWFHTDSYLPGKLMTHRFLRPKLKSGYTNTRQDMKRNPNEPWATTPRASTSQKTKTKTDVNRISANNLMSHRRRISPSVE